MKYAGHVNLDKILAKKGISKENIEYKAAEEIIELCDPYVPKDTGTLKGDVRIEKGNEIVWGGQAKAYAHYVWEGVVYEDPKLHCAGFEVADGGWRSREDVQKVPTDRSLTYGKGNKRGAKWVFRMLQDGGREKLQRVIGRMLNK